MLSFSIPSSIACTWQQLSSSDRSSASSTSLMSRLDGALSCNDHTAAAASVSSLLAWPTGSRRKKVSSGSLEVSSTELLRTSTGGSQTLYDRPADVVQPQPTRGKEDGGPPRRRAARCGA